MTTTSTSVTISGAVTSTVNVPNCSSTQAFKYASAVSTPGAGTTATLLTPGGGKKFYLTGLTVSVGAAATDVRIMDNGTVVWRAGFHAGTTNWTILTTFPTPIPFTTNCQVYNSGNLAASGLYVSISGFEDT